MQIILGYPKENGSNRLFIRWGISSPIPVAMMIYGNAAGVTSEAAFMRCIKPIKRKLGHRWGKVQHPSAMYGGLCQQKFALRVNRNHVRLIIDPNSTTPLKGAAT